MNAAQKIVKVNELEGRYSPTFLRAITARNWELVWRMFPDQWDHFHGKWAGNRHDEGKLREWAEADGYSFE